MADDQLRGRDERRKNIPLRRLYSEAYDYDQDDQIPIKDFMQELRNASDENIPILMIEKALKETDVNDDGIITLGEFLRMVKKTSEGKSKYGGIFTAYVMRTIPPRQKRCRELEIYSDTDGEYEDEYKCCPPPLGMICISLLMIGTFSYDTVIGGYGHFDGPVAKWLIYNPHLREEAWRFVTYMFVHAGLQHLLVNIAVQIMLGLPLEMVHGFWRILIIYTSGVIAGSLITSVVDPNVFLVGASGGVYSLITAHLASIIMNYSEMEFANWQLIVIISLCIVDITCAIYHRYFLEINQQIGYESHLAGAVAGLLIGINILRNLRVRSWENKIWWTAIVTYILLMGIGVIINIAFPSHFPTRTVGIN
ncbi:rhomboid-related protein 2-like isoform X2 [Rhodnius prolixus]|uniref:rhomboid-related protein 2-like isoform X2 n=1 Tax=Rhodnius prolixus TaxID=13249 RepID=UPI003D18EEC4